MAERTGSQTADITRRHFLRNTGLIGLGGLVVGRAAIGLRAETVDLPFVNGQRTLVQFPQKRPLILLTSRPPQLETPFSVFNDGLLTPNDAFFVRYHLSQIPTSIDPEKFNLEIKGRVNSPIKLSLGDLKK